MTSTTAPAATQGEVFSRRATGLVRLGTPWRVLILNFANIGLTYIWFTYWITPGVFPQSNLFLSIAVAGVDCLVQHRNRLVGSAGVEQAEALLVEGGGIA